MKTLRIALALLAVATITAMAYRQGSMTSL